MARPAPFLPASEHLSYLANLLVVMAALYGAWLIWKARSTPRPRGLS